MKVIPPVERRTDDRRRTVAAPPPYRTVQGIVAYDRRRSPDRRLCWIRDFKLDGKLAE